MREFESTAPTWGCGTEASWTGNALRVRGRLTRAEYQGSILPDTRGVFPIGPLSRRTTCRGCSRPAADGGGGHQHPPPPEHIDNVRSLSHGGGKDECLRMPDGLQREANMKFSMNGKAKRGALAVFASGMAAAA